MDSVEFRGDPRDLARFARGVLKQSVTIETPTPFEHRMRWDTGGCSGFGGSMRLRSGLSLSATRLRWEQPWAFQLRETGASLKFMLARGAGPRMTQSNGSSFVMGGGVLQVRPPVGQVPPARGAQRATTTTCAFDQGGGGEFEQLALEVAPDRLRELLGTPALPRMLEALLAATGAAALHEQPMVPALSRLLDEILGAGSGGASRQLFLDELELAGQATAPLSAWDTERLERARRLLLERMTSPPSLPELARAVGLNEFKLKAGFRLRFGASVFGYLRTERLERARRLLANRDLSVSEVAWRVGYENASKFAAAFRKRFGLPPSALR
jgi:AraC-like DNA-binding protein